MYTLFPPYMVAKQNAIIFNEEGRIYFNLSTFNTIDQVKHIQVAINRQDTNENALLTNSLKYATGKYYIVDSNTGRPAQPVQITDTPTSIAQYSDQYPNGYLFISVVLGETVIFDESKQLYYFQIPANVLEPHITYKVQIRFGKQEITTTNGSDWYVDGVEINSAWLSNPDNIRNLSEWSTVGITTALKPFTIAIQDFNASVVNGLETSVYTFVGTNDLALQNPNETILTTEFILYSDSGEMIESSGLVKQPANQKAYNSHTFKTVFKQSTNYKVAFIVNTKNSYSKKIEYRFRSTFEALSATYGIEFNNDNTFLTSNQLELYSTGVRLIVTDVSYANLSPEDLSKRPNSYMVRKTSSRSNFEDWEEIAEIRAAVDGSELRHFMFDTFVESGVTYRYAVQSKLLNTGRGLVSDFIEITPKYNYSWLISQNNLSLKIAYNMDISGYKTVIKESMIETLGGKYPFFVRNGDLKYKQFTLSSLITYNMDVGLQMTEVYDEEYLIEREFRNALEELLLDGKPKVIKTDTEGLMLVYLSNISLNPEKALGRTLYSLNCTVTEIGDFTLENLVKYDLIDMAPQGLGSDIRTPSIVGIAVTGKTITGVY